MQRIDPESLEDKLYSSREVAQLLGVSLRTIYRYIESGKLVPETQTKSGRHLFGKRAILGFLFPDTGYRVQDTGGSKQQEERDGKDRRMEGRGLRVEGVDESRDLRVEDREEKVEDRASKEGIPVEKGEIKFPVEKDGKIERGGLIVEGGGIEGSKDKKMEGGKGKVQGGEIKLTKEGAVAPRHERDILKELS